MKKYEELKYESIYPNSNFDIDLYFAEMSTIVKDNGYNINVNNELTRLSVAYFKVYDNINPMAAKRVVKLHFKDPGMEFHQDPLNKKKWLINSKDIKLIRELLQRPNNINEKYTNWNILCFKWNIDNNLIPSSSNIDQFMKGNFDDKYSKESRIISDRLKSAYVPSTQEIPETWDYNYKGDI